MDLLTGKSLSQKPENQRIQYEFLASLGLHKESHSVTSLMSWRHNQRRGSGHFPLNTPDIMRSTDLELDFEPDSDSGESHRSCSPLPGELNHFSEEPITPQDTVTICRRLSAIQPRFKKRKIIRDPQNQPLVSDSQHHHEDIGKHTVPGTCAISLSRRTGVQELNPNGKRMIADYESPSKRSRLDPGQDQDREGGLCLRKLPKSAFVRQLARIAFELKPLEKDYQTLAICQLEKSKSMDKFLTDFVRNAQPELFGTNSIRSKSIPSEIRVIQALRRDNVI